jgi:tripartite-type tricarboxylate transporter receptor subunit TctC
MITRRQFVTTSIASVAALPFVRRAGAQSWPARHVRLIVPYPAGGGADAIARIVSGHLSQAWGQQIVIENRGGAGGNIAGEAAAKSAPDGYTLYLAGEFHATNPFMYPRLTYDPVADFVPISLVVQYPTCVVVPNVSPVRSIPDFIGHAKASGGRMTFASPGTGTGPHLAAELFKRVAGIEMTHVPYRGAAPAIQDVIPGRVDSFFNNIAPLMALIRQGQLRALAVTTARRVPAAPDIPTLAEQGVASDVSGWYALYAPAKTPAGIVQRVAADTRSALADPAIRIRLEQLGLFVVGSTPGELDAFFKAEMERWQPIIRDAGIKAS